MIKRTVELDGFFAALLVAVKNDLGGVEVAVRISPVLEPGNIVRIQ